MKKITTGTASKAASVEQQVVTRVERRFQNPLLKQSATRRKRAEGVEYFAGHVVAGQLSDGTRILEPVAQPASVTQKEIRDTVRDVLRRAKPADRHAD